MRQLDLVQEAHKDEPRLYLMRQRWLYLLGRAEIVFYEINVGDIQKRNRPNWRKK